MPARLPPLNALRAFDCASRHMSFQKAAEDLNVTPSALSFQIRQLEENLQVKLFVRLNRRVELTEEGARIAPFIHDGFERLETAMQYLLPPQDDNILTVSSGPAFGAKWLSPRVHRFLELYPDIELRISATLKLTDFAADGVDVALRFGGGKYDDLYVEELAEETVAPMVSPATAARFDGGIKLSDLKNLMLLHDDSASFMTQAVTWSSWLKAAGVDDVDTARGARFSHADHAIDAAIDSAGIVLGRKTLAARDLKAGRLICPFDLELKSQASFYFCCPEHKLKMPKVQAFREFVFAEVAEAKV